MRVAFLHGLESNPVSDKSKAVQKIFDYSYTPAMDYKNPNMFNEVLKEIKDRKIDLLVGSSMGGWFSYCISTLTGIPTILFNPALQGRPYEPVVRQGTKSANHTIVLGRKDSEINPQKTYEWFKENGVGNAKFFWEGIGHRTPLEVFTKYVKINENNMENLYEAVKNTSKIHPHLNGMMDHKWKFRLIMQKYNEKHNGAWDKFNEKTDEEVSSLKDSYRDSEGVIPEDKLPEVKEKIEKLKLNLRNNFLKNEVYKDGDFKDEVKDFYEKSDRFEELGNKLKEEGLEKFKKENPKEYDELLDLQANYMNPIKVITKPGGIMQISSANMERGGDEGAPGFVSELPIEVGEDAFRRQLKNYIDKNGKPKGVIMDLRNNTGGQQDIAKSMTDFFVDSDEYDIESQKFNYGPRLWKNDPNGLEKYKDWQQNTEIIDYLNTLSPKEQQKYWDESVKKGYLELPNKRKNKVDDKYRLTDIPVVLQTSTKTFSAGEFAADTIKNLNPNVVHIGSNSGGGAIQTYGGLSPDEQENADKSGTEKAKMVANAYKNVYHDEEIGKKIHDAILSKVKSGDIKNSMNSDEVAKITQEIAINASGDSHVSVQVFDDNIYPMVPQVRSERIIVDRKTGKPILKNGKPQYEHKGNWEQKGVGASGTAPFVETDPNTATKDALEILYTKTGQSELVKKLNQNPKEFGLEKSGKDELFNDAYDPNKSYFAHKHLSGDSGEFSQRQADQIKVSKENAIQNKKEGILNVLKRTQEEFNKNSNLTKKEIEKKATSKIYKDIDPQIIKKLEDKDVTIPNKKGEEKTIKLKTLMDFVPINLKDPKEIELLKAQETEYNIISDWRKGQEMDELIPYKEWMKRKFKQAQDNKDYLERVKKFKEKSKNENRSINTYDQFLESKSINESRINIKNANNMSFVKHYENFVNENLNNKFELLSEKKLIKGYDPEKYVYFNVLPVKLMDYFEENWYNKSEVSFAAPNENDNSDVYNRMSKEDFKKFKDAAEKKGFDLENKPGKLEPISYFEPKK